MTQPTQAQLLEQERRKIAQLNEEFLWHVEHGMTREGLQACIEWRPAVWSRFESWLDKLPSETEQGAS